MDILSGIGFSVAGAIVISLVIASFVWVMYTTPFWDAFVEAVIGILAIALMIGGLMLIFYGLWVATNG